MLGDRKRDVLNYSELTVEYYTSAYLPRLLAGSPFPSLSGRTQSHSPQRNLSPHKLGWARARIPGAVICWQSPGETVVIRQVPWQDEWVAWPQTGIVPSPHFSQGGTHLSHLDSKPRGSLALSLGSQTFWGEVGLFALRSLAISTGNIKFLHLKLSFVGPPSVWSRQWQKGACTSLHNTVDSLTSHLHRWDNELVWENKLTWN